MKTKLLIYILLTISGQTDASDVSHISARRPKIRKKAINLAKKLLAQERSKPDKSGILSRYLTSQEILDLSSRTAIHYSKFFYQQAQRSGHIG